MSTHEINFDGLIGLTHNYAGLAYGNIASMGHKQSVSSPKQAALQGLLKMKFLMELGVAQAVLPPQDRPNIPTLHRLGFSGSDQQILDKAHQVDPVLLASVCSASSMWAANAATVSPSADSADHRVHFTPANLISQFHRSIETDTTTRILRTIFADPSAFVVHDPLPPAIHFSDEGAANHMRLAGRPGDPALEIFVFGRNAFNPAVAAPLKYPARQTREASQAVARSHLLDPRHVLFLQQNPAAIDAGAFHNDVVAVSNQNVILFHEQAFLDSSAILPVAMNDLYSLKMIQIPHTDVTLQQAIHSYLFNSQLVTLPDSSISLIAPVECSEMPEVKNAIDQIRADGLIGSIHFVDVRQSMHNGGGPACLRLRVVLTDSEINKLSGNVLLNESLYLQLKTWIEKHYRDSLHPDDLRDPALLAESRTALDELTQLLELGSLYSFQRNSTHHQPEHGHSG